MCDYILFLLFSQININIGVDVSILASRMKKFLGMHVLVLVHVMLTSNLQEKHKVIESKVVMIKERQRKKHYITDKKSNHM